MTHYEKTYFIQAALIKLMRGKHIVFYNKNVMTLHFTEIILLFYFTVQLLLEKTTKCRQFWLYNQCYLSEQFLSID